MVSHLELNLQQSWMSSRDVELASSSSPPSKADAALLLLLPHLVSASNKQEQQGTASTILHSPSSRSPKMHALNNCTNELRRSSQHEHTAVASFPSSSSSPPAAIQQPLKHSIMTQGTEEDLFQQNHFVVGQSSDIDDHRHSRSCSSLSPTCLFSEIQPDPFVTLLYESSGSSGSFLSAVGKKLKEHIEKQKSEQGATIPEIATLTSEAAGTSCKTEPITQERKVLTEQNYPTQSDHFDKVTTEMDVEPSDPAHPDQGHIAPPFLVTTSAPRHKSRSTSQQINRLSSRFTSCPPSSSWVSPPPTQVAAVTAASKAEAVVRVAPPRRMFPLRTLPLRKSPRKASINTATAAFTSKSAPHHMVAHRTKYTVGAAANRKAVTAAARRRMTVIAPPPHLTAPFPNARRLDAASMSIAARAAELACQILDSDTENSKMLYNALAVQNATTDCKALNNKIPRPGAIHEGFKWCTYPPLEQVLQRHMAEFYEISRRQNQSQIQFDFISGLVEKIFETADQCRWTLKGKMADRRVLRDRVRFYYKTQLQNTKKRLHTCLKHPTNKASARQLIEMWSILQKVAAQCGTT